MSYVTVGGRSYVRFHGFVQSEISYLVILGKVIFWQDFWAISWNQLWQSSHISNVSNFLRKEGGRHHTYMKLISYSTWYNLLAIIFLAIGRIDLRIWSNAVFCQHHAPTNFLNDGVTWDTHGYSLFRATCKHAINPLKCTLETFLAKVQRTLYPLSLKLKWMCILYCHCTAI